MFPGCPEHCNVEGGLSKYFRNIACRLGMGPTPGFLFNGISLQIVRALIDFRLSKVDASVLAKTAIRSLSSFASALNFLLSSI